MIRQIKNRKHVAMGAIAFMILAGACAGAQQTSSPRDKVLAGTEGFARGAVRASVVDLNKEMLKQFNDRSKAHSPGVGVPPMMIPNPTYVQVRQYEYKRPGEYRMADVQKFIEQLDDHGWKPLVRETTDGRSSAICVRNNGEFEEMVIVDAEPTQLAFIHMKGPAAHENVGALNPGGADPSLRTRGQ